MTKRRYDQVKNKTRI